MTDQTIWVTTRDLEIGLVNRRCPTCGSSLVIRLPSLRDAITDQSSAALRLGLQGLAYTDRQLFDLIYAGYPHAVERDQLLATVQVKRASLGTYVTRLRNRLAGQGWQVVREHGTLRLVHGVE